MDASRVWYCTRTSCWVSKLRIAGVLQLGWVNKARISRVECLANVAVLIELRTSHHVGTIDVYPIR